MRRVHLGWAWCLMLLACAEPGPAPGQLIISIESDMASPKDIDAMQVTVLQRDRVLHDNDYAIGRLTDTLLPATLTLAAAGRSLAPITVRVAGRKGTQWRTYRELTSTIPEDRVALLHMPIQWLCDAQARLDPSDETNMHAVTTCGEGFTCRAGQCAAMRVETDELPNYDPSLVLGGKDDTTPASCFDTVACMAGGTLVTPDDSCSIAKPPGENVNVALRVAHDGQCDLTGNLCFVPLDAQTDEGFLADDTTLKLPNPVCAKLRQGLVRGVYVSTGCKAKAAAYPPCAQVSSVPWDEHAIAPEKVTVPVAPVLLARLPMTNGQRIPCCPLTSDNGNLYTCVCSPSDKTSAELYQITKNGAVTSLGLLQPLSTRTNLFFAAAAYQGSLYWVADRLLKKTTLAAGAATASFPVAASLYELASVLVDDNAVYTAATGADVAATPVEILVTALNGTPKTPLTAGDGHQIGLQLDQDANAVYAVRGDRDPADAPSGSYFSRSSRVLRTVKTTMQFSTVLADRAVMTNRTDHGGYLGVQLDGSKLYTLFEDQARPDGAYPAALLRADVSDPLATAKPDTLFTTTLDPASALTVQGVVDGIPLLSRTDKVTLADMTTIPVWSLISVGPDGARIVADFTEDAPVTGLVHDDTRIYWLNQTGTIYALSRAALQ